MAEADEHSDWQDKWSKEPSNGNGKGKRKRRVNSTVEDDGPACHSCRQKKAKCTRTQPCAQCERMDIECVYEERKARPGFKTGAIESLNRRLDMLENMFLGQGVLWQHVINGMKITNQSKSNQHAGSFNFDLPTPSTDTLQDQRAHLQSFFSALSSTTGTQLPREAGELGLPTEHERIKETFTSKSRDHANIGLPPDDLMDALVDIHFHNFHHWIPILHVTDFRRQLNQPAGRRHLSTILHAITSLCARFSDDSRLADPEIRAAYVKQGRDTVILQSMESFSLVNLQALIICAFDTIGGGRGPSAWSIVGSMTRTVEQLQLSVEEDDRTASARLIRRLDFMPPSTCWKEKENRRRLFWNVFLMDRFCSITTGWNLSLTSADVRRRLPYEGALWQKGVYPGVATPYFGVADQPRSTANALPMARQETENQQALGGFAYCIEATESLSLVTSFFLQQAVDMRKVSEVQMWLMRFKELDLRLIQWKIFLPERWQQACALNDDGIMDPNLTLAHITHNTAVVLLHQGIAYPSSEWMSVSLQLPSASSAETCIAAATEVSIIAHEFLQGFKIPTNPQFAFCLFVCGRLLLVHSAFYASDISRVFSSIVESLWEISRRWNGVTMDGGFESVENLASRFVRRLLEAQKKGSTSSMDIRQEAYAQTTDPQHYDGLLQTPKSCSNASMSDARVDSEQTAIHPRPPISSTMVLPTQNQDSPDSISMAYPPLPPAFQGCEKYASAAPARGDAPEIPQVNASFVPEINPAMPVDSSQHLPIDDLNSFLNYDYMLSQRVSMFSYDEDK